MNFNRKKIRLYLFSLVIFSGFVLFAIGYLFLIPAIGENYLFTKINQIHTTDSIRIFSADIKTLRKEIERLKQKNQRLTPGSSFLIINTSDNTFRLYKNNQIIRSGKCSTGSFIQLVVDSTKSYTFETPKGALTVQGKITNPIWRKPDWAFIEEGLPVPPQNHSSRYERNVLGDYALSLGNGYLIHGTLYQRLLGMPVTHGCVRLNDEDLKEVYNTLQLGSKVFIY
ncbi:MAG: L,D-transpeptidase [Prolixibacteraceae bacterium]|nr:L,D-transpeptidase [Prolixibacteraceae bacterium]